MINGFELTWRSRLMAALRWAGTGAMVSHRSAAILHGIEEVTERPLELSIHSGKSVPGVILHRLRDDVRRTRFLGEFPVTLLESTIFDLSKVLKPRRAGRCLDECLRKKMTTLHRLRAEHDRYGANGRSGSRVLGRLLAMRDDRDGRLESRLESDTLRLLRDPRLPRVEPAHRIYSDGRHVARLDFAWPQWRLGLEAHSYRWHFGLDQWRRDLARDNKLKLLGWTVLHYTWDDVHFDREQVLADLLQALDVG